MSPGLRVPVPGSPFPAFGSYPQRLMDIRPCKNHHIRVKIGQNGDVFRQKAIKKGAHFVMPILTFWGVTPSGASARADFAFRKGKKGAFSGPPRRVQKLSTISTKGTPWRTFRMGEAAADIESWAPRGLARPSGTWRGTGVRAAPVAAPAGEWRRLTGFTGNLLGNGPAGSRSPVGDAAVFGRPAGISGKEPF